MVFFKKLYLAIALFFLRIPTILTVMFIYCLFQVVLQYNQILFLLPYSNVVECAEFNAEDIVLLEKTSQPSNTNSEVTEASSSGKVNSISYKSQDNQSNDLKVTINLESDTTTVLSGALTSVGKALETYVPIISSAAVAAGITTIMKSVPAK
jgi:hypothetical protein